MAAAVAAVGLCHHIATRCLHCMAIVWQSTLRASASHWAHAPVEEQSIFVWSQSTSERPPFPHPHYYPLAYALISRASPASVMSASQPEHPADGAVPPHASPVSRIYTLATRPLVIAPTLPIHHWTMPTPRWPPSFPSATTAAAWTSVHPARVLFPPSCRLGTRRRGRYGAPPALLRHAHRNRLIRGATSSLAAPLPTPRRPPWRRRPPSPPPRLPTGVPPPRPPPAAHPPTARATQTRP